MIIAANQSQDFLSMNLDTLVEIKELRASFGFKCVQFAKIF